jgi:hypothetical protein
MAVKIKSAIKNRDINGMFNEMCGEGVVPPHIAFEKYTKLKDKVTSFLTLLESFCKGSFVKTYTDYEVPMAEILVFCQTSRREVETSMPEPPFSEMDIMKFLTGESKLNTDAELKFSETYKHAKNLNVVANCVKTCNQLIKYKNYLNIKDETGKSKPNGEFIINSPGGEFRPLYFSSFNIKDAFIRKDMTDHFRNYILMVLAMTIEYTYDIYNIYISPDWDPNVFSQIMTANIDEVKKQIPRCGKAFHKIEQSLGLLESNMGNYYKDFVVTRNPSTMMENFVNDVASKNEHTDSETTRQFKEIIKHYQKMSGGKITDPRIKTLFDQVNSIAGDSILSEKTSGDLATSSQ